MARPLELTDAITDAICARIGKGSAITKAGESQGFGSRTVETWRARGAQEDAPEVCQRFRRETTRARARFRESLEDTVVDAAKHKVTGPSYAQWLLERRFSEDYSQKQVIAHEVHESIDEVVEDIISRISTKAGDEVISALESIRVANQTKHDS